MTNVVRATLSYSQGTDVKTKWAVKLLEDKMLTGMVVEIEGDIYACIGDDGNMRFFDANKVLYMRMK